MDKKKKILILIEWFSPGFKAGGPIQSCVNICRAFNKEYDIYVLTTDTDHGETSTYDNIVANEWSFNSTLGVHIYYAAKKNIHRAQIKKIIEDVNAAAIYVNLLFSPLFAVYPIWLKLSGAIKSKVLVCPRGTLYESALSLKSYKKKPLLLLYRWLGISRKLIFHATNQREAKAILKHFPGSRIIIADNLPNINQPSLQTCKKEAGSIRCVFIARIVPIKNLQYVLKFLNNINISLELSIVGPIENEAYWKSCQEEILHLPDNISVNYLGTRNNSEISELLQAHHLMILPTTGENFGHAIFESLLVGRPVLISDQTPWLGLEATGAGWDLPLNKPELFENKIEILAAADQAKFDFYTKAAWEYARNFIQDPSLLNDYKPLFD